MTWALKWIKMEDTHSNKQANDLKRRRVLTGAITPLSFH